VNIGFTGTQEGTTPNQFASFCKLVRALSALDADNVFHNGDCIGADEETAIFVHTQGWKIHLHPPLNNGKRAFLDKIATWVSPRLQYLDRNKNIVNESNILIATPSGPEKLRSGTWSTVRYAIAKQKRTYIIYPDGNIVVKNYQLP